MNVNEAIAAVKANPSHPESPLPWRADDMFVRCADYGGRVAQWVDPTNSAHIAAAVNAAPVLLARVAELESRLEAARVAVEKLPKYRHTQLRCSPRDGCCCGATGANMYVSEARRALGLEVSP